MRRTEAVLLKDHFLHNGIGADVRTESRQCPPHRGYRFTACCRSATRYAARGTSSCSASK